MATKGKSTAKTATVRNPAQRLISGATTKKKTTTKKKGTSVYKKATTKKNPARPAYRRNPALSNEFVVAFGGALVINAFDIAVNRFLPTVSGLVRTGAKFGIGWVIGKYGKRLPLIGSFSQLIKSALYIAGALDLVSTYAVPYVNQWLGAAPAAQPQLVAANVKTAAGEMGNLYQSPDGSQFIVVDDRAGDSYGYQNPNAYGYGNAYAYQ